MPRRFPPPWTVAEIPGGYRIDDANGHALAYVYARDNAGADDDSLTLDEARRIAANIARLPELLKRR